MVQRIQYLLLLAAFFGTRLVSAAELPEVSSSAGVSRISRSAGDAGRRRGLKLPDEWFAKTKTGTEAVVPALHVRLPAAKPQTNGR